MFTSQAPQSFHRTTLSLQLASPSANSVASLRLTWPPDGTACCKGVTVSHRDCHHAYSRLLCGREGGDVVEDYHNYVKMFLTTLSETDLKEPLPPFSTKN